MGGWEGNRVDPGFKRHYIQPQDFDLDIPSHSEELWTLLLRIWVQLARRRLEEPKRGRKPLASDFNLRKHVFPKFRDKAEDTSNSI